MDQTSADWLHKEKWLNYATNERKKTPTFKFGNDSFKQTWKSLTPSNKTLNEKKKKKRKEKNRNDNI